MEDFLNQLRSKRDAISTAARRHGASNIRLLDYSPGNGKGVRDLADFVVALEPGRTLMDLGGLQMDVMDILMMDVGIATDDGMRMNGHARELETAIAI